MRHAYDSSQRVRSNTERKIVYMKRSMWTRTIVVQSLTIKKTEKEIENFEALRAGRTTADGQPTGQVPCEDT